MLYEELEEEVIYTIDYEGNYFTFLKRQTSCPHIWKEKWWSSGDFSTMGQYSKEGGFRLATFEEIADFRASQAKGSYIKVYILSPEIY